MMHYKAVYDARDASWHVAHIVPGTDTWHSDVQTLSRNAAQRLAEEMNAAAEHERKERQNYEQPRKP